MQNRFQTNINAFGLWKDYHYRPSQDPDAFISPEDLYRANTSNTADSTAVPGLRDTVVSSPSPYKTNSIKLVIDWQNTGSSTKSNKEINRLVHDVLRHPDFWLGELKHFNAACKNRKANATKEDSPFLQSFTHANISIDVPSGSKHKAPHMVSIPGLYFRKITSLIEEAFQSPLALHFHLSPYNLYQKHPDSEANDSERMYSELYDSDVFYDEHDKVQRAPIDNQICKREKVVAALMFWLDAMHLATFGTAKMWPVYMLFGNLSKYIRFKSKSGATKHLAYIPPLPDSLQDKLKAIHPKWDTQQKSILTHCRWELMHAVWKFLLDDNFIHAHIYRIVVRCHDGVERCIYPRIFTYSTDYPEK